MEKNPTPVLTPTRLLLMEPPFKEELSVEIPMRRPNP